MADTVKDMMTRSVVSVRPETSIREVARLLIEHRISGLPVVDDAGAVVGVVSEGDLLVHGRDVDHVPRRPLARLFGRQSAKKRKLKAKAQARTAGEAMTAPAIMADVTAPVHTAATLMSDHRIKRLPVVADGRLVGIVTRADIVRAFVRTDAELAVAIRDEVLLRRMWLDPRDFQVSVTDGIATVKGSVGRRSTATMVKEMVEMLPGIVAVEADVSWSVDDHDIQATGPDYRSPGAAS